MGTDNEKRSVFSNVQQLISEMQTINENDDDDDVDELTPLNGGNKK